MSDQDQPSSADDEQTRNASPSQTERGSGDAAGGERGAGRHGGRRRRGGGQSSPSRQQPGGQQPRRAEAALNMEELRELTELFTAHKLTDFEFENADIRVRLSRNPAPQFAAPTLPVQTPTTPPTATGSESPATGAASDEVAPATSATRVEAKEEDLHIITSPIVGTFYRAASPNADAFVKAGSHVEADTVVCIIEAMKLMNEIQAETTGLVEKIYVENGQPVEYGQPLFGIKK